MSEQVLKPHGGTCNPEVPSQKCADRLRAESLGAMRFNAQARGWEYPVPVVRLRGVPIETWEFCPFCLIALPEDEVPRYAKQIPYRPPRQADDPK